GDGVRQRARDDAARAALRRGEALRLRPRARPLGHGRVRQRPPAPHRRALSRAGDRVPRRSTASAQPVVTRWPLPGAGVERMSHAPRTPARRRDSSLALPPLGRRTLLIGAGLALGGTAASTLPAQRAFAEDAGLDPTGTTLEAVAV